MHLARIAVGYILACSGTALTAYIVVLRGVPGAAKAWDLMFGWGMVSTLRATLALILCALLPACFVLVPAEYFQVRSWLFYLCTGQVASALVVWAFTGFLDWGGIEFYGRAFAAVGIAFLGGAYVYWAIAGRHAGFGPQRNSLQAGFPQSKM